MESKLIRWLDLFAKQWVGKTLGIVFSTFRKNDRLANSGKGVSLQNYLNIGSIPILISTAEVT